MRPARTRHRSRSRWRVWCLVLGALWPSLGLGPASAEAQERGAAPPDGVYRRPLGHDPATLDPARLRDIYSLAVGQQLFDGLVQFDQTLSITPALAQFWIASRDGLVWTFTLRKGVKFHHGREVTSDDVIYSFTRLLDPQLRSGGADLFMTIRGAAEFREGRSKQVTGLAAPDRYTVRVTLTEAPVPFVSILAVGQAKIVPRELVEAQGEAFGAQPVGTGPFRFVRWERGKEIVLAANSDYFDGPPKLARLVYRIFPGERLDRVFAEFQAGGLEDTPIPSKDYRQIITSPARQYVRRPMFNLRHYGLNTRMKPLDDRRVRQALVYAIDREAIVSDVWLGRYALARGVLPPGTLGFNPKLRGYPYDPARARELLAQAGYPGGRGLPPIAIWSSVRSEEILREHERVRKDLEAVGITAEFQYNPDWPSFSRAMAERRLPVFLRAWFADVPHPDNFLAKLFHSASPWNYMGYGNQDVDSLLDRARGEPDIARRVEIYRRAEEVVLDDAPVIPVWHQTYERLFQPYVKGVEVSGLGDGYIPFRKVWLERPR
ncbi:MAG TPA: ABC transporter substrate-binding protein [Methylomirabilota bacterium]|jgi:peptide/nickel transport system substrate-binding protein/oligopeptide transport system substrate-binding protein|nr:ABC transporter substrate-binding protein [Methylomirabilota bacterium]